MTRIALIQTTSSDDFQANFSDALERVEEAAAAGAELAAFPEVFLYIGGRKAKLEHAQSLDGEVVTRFREAARRLSVAILLGSIHERIPGREDKVYNTALWIDAAGEILAAI